MGFKANVTQKATKRQGNTGQDTTSKSGVVSNSSIDGWTTEEQKLFSLWATSFEKYNDGFNNPYFDYFFTGQDVQISLFGLDDPVDTLPIFSFAYNIEQQKQPLYGFWNYTYNAMLRGTRIVTGAFTIVATEPQLLTKTIAKAALNVAKGTPKSLTDYYYIRDVNNDQRNVDKYWRKNYEDNLDAGQQHLFSVHPPFHFIIKFGIQSTSLAARNPSYRAAEIMQKFNDNSAYMVDINERLVKDTSDQSMVVALENIELMSKATQYDTAGQPILETYTFMARDERILAPGGAGYGYTPSTTTPPRSSGRAV